MSWKEFHDKLDLITQDVTGEARKALAAELAGLKETNREAIAKGKQLIGELESAVSATQPAGTRETVLKLVGEFVAYLEKMLLEQPLSTVMAAAETQPAEQQPAVEKPPAAEEPAEEEPAAEEPVKADAERG